MLGTQIDLALVQYKEEVRGGTFPTQEFSPYKMGAEQQRLFEELMGKDVNERNENSKKIGRKLNEADEYDAVKLY